MPPPPHLQRARLSPSRICRTRIVIMRKTKRMRMIIRKRNRLRMRTTRKSWEPSVPEEFMFEAEPQNIDEGL